MLMVQRRTEKSSQEQEEIKMLEERVRELEKELDLQHREQEPKDELNDLYLRRSELVSRLVVEKDDAKNKELWESLPAIERQKYARWVFEQRKREVEDTDTRIEEKELRSGKRVVSNINRAIGRVEEEQRRKRLEREEAKR